MTPHQRAIAIVCAGINFSSDNPNVRRIAEQHLMVLKALERLEQILERAPEKMEWLVDLIRRGDAAHEKLKKMQEEVLVNDIGDTFNAVM